MSASEIKAYLAKIGAKGGKKSRRVLTTEQARAMNELSIESKKSAKQERIAIARKAGKAPKKSRKKNLGK